MLTDEFLDSLADKEKPNLQMGLLRRLINDEIKTVRRTNVVQARKILRAARRGRQPLHQPVAVHRRDHRRVGQTTRRCATTTTATISSGCAGRDGLL